MGVRSGQHQPLGRNAEFGCDELGKLLRFWNRRLSMMTSATRLDPLSTTMARA